MSLWSSSFPFKKHIVNGIFCLDLLLEREGEKTQVSVIYFVSKSLELLIVLKLVKRFTLPQDYH